MFWEKFVQLCLAKGVSPNTVAAECGVRSSGTVTGWKKGAEPRPSIQKKIAEYFSIPVSYFNEETKKSPSESITLSDEEILIIKALRRTNPDIRAGIVTILSPWMESVFDKMEISESVL